MPERTCCACGAQRTKAELFRFVAESDGTIELDLYARRPGRGAYTCRNAECVDRALNQRRLARALRAREAQNPATLRRQVVEYLL